MISRLLVATDGSESSRKAVRYAAYLAGHTGSDIILLSVRDEQFFVKPPPLALAVEDYTQRYAEACIREAEKICHKNGIQTKASIRTGRPADEIMKEAKKSKVNMIVMGSHGRTAMGAALLGSVAYGVIHKDTKIPVLVVR